MFVLAEVAVVRVYPAALAAACGCFAYLLVVAVRERRLRPGLLEVEPQAVLKPATAERMGVTTQALRALPHHG